jgi:hypothetical protein
MNYKNRTRPKNLPSSKNTENCFFPVASVCRSWGGNNGWKATVGVISLRVHCHTLNGLAADLWLLVCVHTTCGCYENFKSANTHCGCHLTERWRASSRHDSVVSIVRVRRCETHTHAELCVRCVEVSCSNGLQPSFPTGLNQKSLRYVLTEIVLLTWDRLYFLSLNTSRCSSVSSQIGQVSLNQFTYWDDCGNSFRYECGIYIAGHEMSPDVRIVPLLNKRCS